MTERQLLDALWGRLNTLTNGGTPRYVMGEHVRYHPAWGTSIADAIAVDTWGSGRYELEGYEVKCSRSDWRRELTTGDWFNRTTKTLHRDVPHVKSFPWRQHCTRWYILAPVGVVGPEELPDGWGLIEARDGFRLRSVVRSAHFPTVPLRAQQVAGLMRAVQQTTTRHSQQV